MIMKRRSLSPPERELLDLATRATFANPFSAERRRLDRRMAGDTAAQNGEAVLQKALARVEGFFAQLDGKGPGPVDRFPAEDRELLRYAHLFVVFHHFIDRLDNLIRQQAAAGEKACPAPFANQALAMIAARGVDADTAERVFAMFYQLRRAFYLIATSLVGRSNAMQELRCALWNNVFTHDMRLCEQHLWNRMEDFSTLLLGETGTGKGAAAAAIGRSGFIPFNRAENTFTESFARSFLAINLSQYPETLIESELFGHRKGAFTGAVEEHEGVFSRCSPHGAIFLDEIGDVSVPTQIKLLQVLQERTFTPVGSHRTQRFHGRVIAASNRSIHSLRRRGLFRDDFFYRLCSDIIVVPPLRQRIRECRDELHDLVTFIVPRIVGADAAELAEEVHATLVRNVGIDYAWPGNVRELEQAVRRVLLKQAYEGDAQSVAPGLRDRMIERIDAGAIDAAELVAGYCALLYRRFGTYEEVARRTRLDRRTVKKYIQSSSNPNEQHNDPTARTG